MLAEYYEKAVAEGKMPPVTEERPLGYDVERVTTESGHVYDVANKVFYSPGTNGKIIALIDGYLRAHTRLRLHYGDVVTGKDWMDEYDVTGRLSTSTGPVRIPIICDNARSSHGTPVLTDCIVRARFANRAHGWKQDLYRHPTYYVDMDEFRAGIPEDQQAKVWRKHFA